MLDYPQRPHHGGINPSVVVPEHSAAESSSTNRGATNAAVGRCRSRIIWCCARNRLDNVEGEFVPVRLDGSIEPMLLFDHDAIVKKAAQELRARYELTPDPENLLDTDEITLPDLQAIHQEVLDEEVRTDTFRRRMEAMLTMVPDPNDPTGTRQKTRPSGERGGPPTRVWQKIPLGEGPLKESQ